MTLKKPRQVYTSMDALTHHSSMGNVSSDAFFVLVEKCRKDENLFLLIVVHWKNYLPRKCIMPPKPAQRVKMEQHLLERV